MRCFRHVAAAAAAVALVTGPAAAADKKKDGEKLVCKSSPDTTSRITRTRVCRTREEWAQEELARRHDAEQGLANTRFREAEADIFRRAVGEAGGRARGD